YHKNNNSQNNQLDNAYKGHYYSNDVIKNALDRSELKYEKHQNIEKEIAKLLSKDKVIGRFNGPMEWGPRALGNRSIIVSAQDKSINDILNKRLSRTEFMPFAPIIMEEYAKDYFVNYNSSDVAARYMTITYDVVKDKQHLIPAVVHVDGTARPQVVRKEDNESLYNILKHYYEITGIPVLINTSFNMHEEPIVCCPNDALRAFKMGSVDYLAIDDFLVTKM
ncbi:MAG: carbamoyltransferase, partial [Spirochaetes bacterium]|nr:carbamoyltransferase [Spirochaetota bacterium]